MKKSIGKNALQSLVALAVIVGVWLIAHAVVGNELLVPSFSDCIRQVGRLLTSSTFWTAFLRSLGRVFLAFAVSLVFALVFALVAYLLPSFGWFFAPIVSVLRSVPTLCVLLIILVWTTADVAPTVVAFLSLFPILYTGISAGLRGVDKELVEMSKVYKVSWKKRIFSLYLPAALPYVTRECVAGLSFSLKLVVSAEVLAGTYGSLGSLMQEAKIYAEMPTLFALVIVTFLTGFLLEWFGELFAAWVERRVK
ncbi:MAG: ABC transporter permease subunit [Clostridia bacterium]|nr:ABC transporter permease subunit [Clostridia bacterium]